MSDIEKNKTLVRQFWLDLYETRDYQKVGQYFAQDGLYRDIPTPDQGARGPQAITKRLKIGLDVIDKHVHHLHRMVAEGDTVVTVHTEDWHFRTGEVVSLPFVSVQVIDENGKIKEWSDYWDMNTLMSGAPKSWLEHIAKFSEADFHEEQPG